MFSLFRHSSLALACSLFLTTATVVTTATAQDSYLSDQASNPDTTDGVARLLHYLPEDIPIRVVVPEPQSVAATQKREAVVRALEAWQEAVPDLVQFEITESLSEDVLRVTWQTLEEGKIGSYQYTYSVQEDGQYRFRATDIFLDPRLDSETLYRYALVQVGHALGLLGRSPFEGDAMSQSPSGVISERDKATLRALYAVPSGTPLF
jgi:predicted Zn-dependent protease